MTEIVLDTSARFIYNPSVVSLVNRIGIDFGQIDTADCNVLIAFFRGETHPTVRHLAMRRYTLSEKITEDGCGIDSIVLDAYFRTHYWEKRRVLTKSRFVYTDANGNTRFTKAETSEIKCGR